NTGPVSAADEGTGSENRPKKENEHHSPSPLRVGRNAGSAPVQFELFGNSAYWRLFMDGHPCPGTKKRLVLSQSENVGGGAARLPHEIASRFAGMKNRRMSNESGSSSTWTA